MRRALIRAGIALVCLGPMLGAALSPLLAWRDPIYIMSGFAGIAGFVLLLVQPVLALGGLPDLAEHRARRLHRISGGLLLLAVLLHVGGLWITSPPDVVDALLFVSPTPFSAWGVIAMWALFATAALALAARHGRRRWKLRWKTWSRGHRILGACIAVTTTVHVLRIEGTMDPVSKIALSALVCLAGLAVLIDARLWRR